MLNFSDGNPIRKFEGFIKRLKPSSSRAKRTLALFLSKHMLVDVLSLVTKWEVFEKPSLKMKLALSFKNQLPKVFWKHCNDLKNYVGMRSKSDLKLNFLKET